jgi:hypothetical protein
MDRQPDRRNRRETGLRSTIASAAVAGLALSARRREHGDLPTWRGVMDEVLDRLG